MGPTSQGRPAAEHRLPWGRPESSTHPTQRARNRTAASRLPPQR